MLTAELLSDKNSVNRSRWRNDGGGSKDGEGKLVETGMLVVSVLSAVENARWCCQQGCW